MKCLHQISVNLLVLLSIPFSHSQSFEHRFFKYDWKDDEIRQTVTQSENFKDYNAVILYEETTIDVLVQNIKRYQIIQFNDQKAIDEFNLFRVPIIMDPRLSYLQSIYRNDTISFPQLLYEKINFFDARIIRNGEIKKAVLDELAYRNEERLGDRLLPFYVHYFYIRNLEPGDQLEIIISHNWPLGSYNYYVNDLLPKQEVNIRFNNTALGQVNLYENSKLATLSGNDISGDKTNFMISFLNVQPVDPSISTDITQLPRIEFYENKKYETSNKMFGKSMIDTLEWIDCLYRYVSRIDPAETRTWDNYDAQSYKTTQFFEKMQKMAGGKLSGAQLMNFIHQYVVNKLEYKNDFNYFIHTEHGFHDIGSYLEENILREACRHEFYFNMLDRINQTWFKVMLQDKRLQIIDTAHVGIMYGDYLSYVIFDKDSFPYLFIPKSGRSGYYANELPFYLEDQFAYLIPQTVPRAIYDQGPYAITYPLLYCSSNPYESNLKKVVSKINVKLEQNYTEAVTNVYLSGQFSTLTRGYYLYGDKDTTISPLYYNDFYSRFPVHNTVLDSSQQVFPFVHSFNITSSGFKNIFATVDNEYVIALGQLINTHFDLIDTNFFKADYLHDFMGMEEYIIEITFDKLVKVEDAASYNAEISAPGFILVSSLTKITDNQIGIKINWDVKEKITGRNDMADLQKAFNKLSWFSKMKIKVKPL